MLQGGLSGTEAGRTHVTFLGEEGVSFKTSACPRFVKEGYFFVPMYEVWRCENTLTNFKQLLDSYFQNSLFCYPDIFVSVKPCERVG